MVPCMVDSGGGLDDTNNGFSLSRFLPYVGMVTIVMNDYPWLKVGVFAEGEGEGGSFQLCDYTILTSFHYKFN